MSLALKRKLWPYTVERDRLLNTLSLLDPADDEYQTVLCRLDEIDRILNRTTDLKKTFIPALGTVAAILGIYIVQQFGGIIIPKALESHAARQDQKKIPQYDI